MDDFYCNINILKQKRIEIVLFDDDKKLTIKNYPLLIKANNTQYLFLLMSICDVFSKLSPEHLLYLGKEIYKAELSLLTGQIYIQE